MKVLSIFLTLFVLALYAHGQAPPTIDGYTYKTIKIGDQEWFAENLRTTVYANGDQILSVRTDEQWDMTNEGLSIHPYFGRNVEEKEQVGDLFYSIYGSLYNGHAVMDARNLCPKGWHIPTDSDWMQLEIFLGMSASEVAGYGLRAGGRHMLASKLKKSGDWAEGDLNNDSYGFSAQPGGGTDDSGNYDGFSGYCFFWTSSIIDDGLWARTITKEIPGILRAPLNFNYGLSIRCVRD